MMYQHVSRIEAPGRYLGSTWRLLDPEGDFIEAYDLYQVQLQQQGYAMETLRRYAAPPVRMIDFFYEVGILGEATTSAAVHTAIEDFRSLLAYGAQSPVDRVKHYAEKIGMTQGLKPKSLQAELAAINIFLRLCQDLADRTIEQAKAFKLPHADLAHLHLTIKAIQGSRTLDRYERKRLMQNTVYGGVVRLLPQQKLERPRNMTMWHATSTQTMSAAGTLDFPVEYFGALIEALPSYRDKMYFCLLGGGGLRGHEVQNLLFSHINRKEQKVYVMDPRGARGSQIMSANEKLRFKGRATARVVMFEPAKSAFFEYFKHYVSTEYVPNCGHDYLLQVIEPQHRSKPLKDASDRGLLEIFRRAQRKIGVPGPDPLNPLRLWTPHSLRHMYGVWMLNYVPLGTDRFGFQDISIVQSLMGHATLDATKHYARHDKHLLELKMAVSDDIIHYNGLNLQDLPDMVARRLMREAERLLVRNVKP